MPPLQYSRYAFCVAVKDAVGDLVLYGEEPYRFRDFPDNRIHTVAEGDTLHSLAARYYQGLPRPARFWFVIADFQPEPLHDPTIQLATGQLLYVPSTRTLQEEIFSERRRRQTEE